MSFNSWYKHFDSSIYSLHP